MISSVCGHGQKGYSQVFVFSFCRFEVELVSTGEVKEYSASANYELQREGNDQIDTLKFAVQAEGKSQKKTHVVLLCFELSFTRKDIFINES